MFREVSLDSSNSSIFEPLRDPTREIRLLRLQPAESDYDLIHCSLHNVQLNKSTKYIVLGSSEGRLPYECGILCNEQLVLVTADFHFRLRHLRDLGWHWIWIEELCIDLGNANESAAQQKLVPAIFRQAIQRFIKDFHYDALPSKNHIRLIELGPAESIDAPIYIHIHSVSLDQAPRFNVAVLPYDMPEGSEPPRYLLTCNRKALRVTWSVLRALQSLRSEGLTSFWFKPICVNHQDPDELSSHDLLRERIANQAVLKMAIDRPDYQYGPLKSSHNEVRLLQIRVGKSTKEPIVAELITVSLDESPHYVALSYTWGPDERNYLIFCSNGYIFRVTRNLFTALHNVRQQLNTEFRIWADQICINQLDNEERNVQVLMMGRIYRQATSVIVHLGGGICSNERPHSCHTHWRILMRILALTKRTLRAVRTGNEQIYEAEFPKFGIPPFHHRSWKLWRLLRAHPWFSRGWIIQEATACPNVWVIFDGQMFRLADLLDANSVSWYENIPLDEAKQVLLGRRLLADLSHRDSLGHIRPHRLLTLLISFRYVQTTDPRDKIYAFRGMATDGETSPLPDYGQSVGRVYHEYAKHFLTQGHGLELIREAGLSKASLDIPSWVVDWSYNSHNLACNYSRGTRYPPVIAISDESDAVVELTDDPSILSVIGAVVDSVIGTTPGIRPLGVESTSDSIDDFIEFDVAAQALLVQAETLPRIYKEGLQNAYASTLIADDDRFKDPVAVYEDAKAYVHQLRKGKNSEKSSVNVRLELTQYFNRRTPCLEMRRFCITQKGHVGLVPVVAEEDDQICVFVGCETPFVVRKRGDSYMLVGDAYIHGIMHGGAMDMEDLNLETIFLQ